MQSTENNPQPNFDRRVLLMLMFVATIALGAILLPFYGTILWGAIIALLFAPVYRWLLPRCRRRRTLAALLTLLAVLLIGVLPSALVTAALAREAANLVQGLQSGAIDPARYLLGLFDALPESAKALLERAGMADFETLQRRGVAELAKASQFIATQALGIGQNTFQFVASLFITLYLAFFLVRDGVGLVDVVKRAVPLSAAHSQNLIDTFGTAVQATVRGNLLIAAIQGALGGLAFWFLGLSGAVLWAVAMAFLSLLPSIGAALVWLPVAIWFLLTGGLWQGLALIAWGLLVIGLIDNLLRPVLVGRDTGLPDYLVLISTLGGMAVFGLNGFVLGPVIAAMFIAVWHIHGVVRDQEACQS
jgi:predicted PurR-regulated permease PerM